MLIFSIVLSWSAHASWAQQVLTARDSAVFRHLVEVHAHEPSVIHFDTASKKFQVVILSKKELKSALGINGNSLENDYFKVVAGGGPRADFSLNPASATSAQANLGEVKSEFLEEKALPLSDFDGRNVLYHLMIARNYFRSFDAKNIAVDRKITVRVRVSNDYNVVTHIAARSMCNNSRYIYADYKDRWQGEIWFHVPSQKQDDAEAAILKTLGKRLNITWGPTEQNPDGYSLTVGVNIPVGDRFIDRWKDIGMDLAKVPSVIYHEAFHWASDDPYPMTSATEGNPIKEDFANYFGSVLNGNDKIAELEAYVDPSRERDFSGVTPISTSNTVQLNYNFTNFIPQVLWDLRRAAPNPREFDEVVWSMIKSVTAQTKPSGMHPIIEQAIGAHYGRLSPFYRSATYFMNSMQESFDTLDWVFADYYGNSGDGAARTVLSDSNLLTKH